LLGFRGQGFSQTDYGHIQCSRGHGMHPQGPSGALSRLRSQGSCSIGTALRTGTPRASSRSRAQAWSCGQKASGRRRSSTSPSWMSNERAARGASPPLQARDGGLRHACLLSQRGLAVSSLNATAAELTAEALQRFLDRDRVGWLVRHARTQPRGPSARLMRDVAAPRGSCLGDVIGRARPQRVRGSACHAWVATWSHRVVVRRDSRGRSGPMSVDLAPGLRSGARSRPSRAQG
jgi:hypothetical protein